MNNTRTGDQSPSSSLRLFLAVPIGEEQRKSVALLSENLKQRLFFGKWTHPADYHLTLKFLGTVDADTAGRMAPVLAEIARRTPPFELELSRLGIFGAPGSPGCCGPACAGHGPAGAASGGDRERRRGVRLSA
ncbi:2'-5' RNA ligase [Paenibacillus larvae subsp. pulvifaciens]|uniref:2'-5' RNA ligase n=1 Tax=Paenibacillus larvae subsp. pulvifaciens TaxID=1477 RepID=A0A1V0UVE9_9BACL|nr:RNA 2',3'-cyclic phosphodiesterase [Paenibacillus larvae]ARF68988.1 2'-5' RNA ligase [Paenibacillus larvae subsp. pulvifaciens]